MPTILVDGKSTEISGSPRLNCIQAARLAGVEIPHYCWHPGLTVVGSCRMCLIEVGTKDAKTGYITMQPKLVPACNTIASDGTVIVTNSEKVAHARAMVEEGLLLNHPIDCPICDKAGECVLQDYHFQYGQDERRADLKPFTSRRRDIGDVTLFVDRCILCSRCVRFTREITGTKELLVAHRGAHEEIEVLPGHELNNKLSGNVVDLCPVGALGDKEFLYKQRVWFLRRHKSVCTGCARGCSIWIEENQDQIYRIKPRENPDVNQWWICNDGRYNYPYVHDPRRLASPLRREGEKQTPVDWTTLFEELPESMRQAGSWGAIISPFLTVEEAYLLCAFIKSIDPNAALAIGPIPKVGEDELFRTVFPSWRKNLPTGRGVEAIVAHFTGKWTVFEDVVAMVEQGSLQNVWIAGGYRDPWIDETVAQRFEKVKMLVVQDLFPSLLAERADYLLPSAAFAEKEGSYVNGFDRLQTARRAIRPPLGLQTEGHFYWNLLGKKGMFDPRAVLNDIAQEILYFSAAADPIPDVGVSLRINQLAENILSEKNA